MGALKPPFSLRDQLPLDHDSAVLAEASISLSVLPLTNIPEAHTGILHGGSISHCLEQELDLSRLNIIHELLWWAGRQVPARELHRQRMLGRELVIAERTDLHLVTSGSRIFIKPLPLYLLSHHFWETYLCGNLALNQSAHGLLSSYLWLVRHESDLRIAKEANILPKWISWRDWASFAGVLYVNLNFDDVARWKNKRFAYGELRLNRLNHIYRLAPQFRGKHLSRGYMAAYFTYSDFFKAEFAWLLILFVYGSIVLQSLQVGLSTQHLGRSFSFQGFAQVFTLITLFVSASACVVVALLYVCLFLFNFVRAVRFDSQRKRQQDAEKVVE
ncbi:hypothetical protein G7Y79_00002g007540 [Physcia stellaris]|nr:hypothetical protein G7Y79_00002g007540 [Physcia stellaris]